MIRASFWQWERYQFKLTLRNKLEANLNLPVVSLSELLSKSLPQEEILNRRVSVSGEYDFTHEVVLQNRKLEDEPGVFVITPLKVDGLEKLVLVNRGFIPFADGAKDKRVKFQKESKVSFQGLVKESISRKLFAPKDDEQSLGKTWVDRWLRVDLPLMQRQLPYQIYPLYLEVMGDVNADSSQISSQILKSGAGREELFFLPSRLEKNQVEKIRDYPVPVFDTIVPPDRHLGYVYEWGAMAVLTGLICLVIQFKPRRAITSEVKT